MRFGPARWNVPVRFPALAGVTILVAGLLILVVPAPDAGAEDGAPPGPVEEVQVDADEVDCLECHGSALTATFQGRTVNLRIDPAAFSASPHGNTGCTYCHISPVHVPLDQVRVRALGTCGNCHRNHDFAGTVGRFTPVEASAPASLPATAGSAGLFVHPDPPLTCGSCHGDIHAAVRRSDPASPLSRGKVVGFCGSCHRTQTEAYLYSYHGSAYRLGSKHTPVCSDCHGHLPPVSSDPEAATTRDGQETCAKCHVGGAAALANLQASGMEHVTPLDRTAGVDGLSRWVVWKFFLLLILFNTTKDGIVIITDLTRRLRRAGPTGGREHGR